MDVPELDKVRKQFKYKYGKKYVQDIFQQQQVQSSSQQQDQYQNNQDYDNKHSLYTCPYLNETVLHKIMPMKDPHPFLIQAYIDKIYELYEIEQQ